MDLFIVGNSPQPRSLEGWEHTTRSWGVSNGSVRDINELVSFVERLCNMPQDSPNY